MVIKAPNWIGDAVLAGPFVETVRKRWPRAHVAVMARARIRPVIERVSRPHEVITEPRGALSIARLLREGCYDLAFTLSSSLRAAAGLALARIPVRIGFRGGWRGAFLTRSIPFLPRSLHQVKHCLALAVLAGAHMPRDPVPAWRVTPRDRAEARRFMRKSGIASAKKLVALAPGASFGPAKRWFTLSWAELADRFLLEGGLEVVLVGGAEERPLTAAIRAMTARPVHDAAGRLGIGGTAALLAMCRAFVSNDSGLMHVGAAAGVPTLGIFGSSNPAWTAPLGRRASFIWGRPECSPCYRRRCLPGRDYACLRAVTPGGVIERITAMAGGGRGR